MARSFAIRLLPVLLVLLTTALWFADVEDNAFLLRNLLPLLVLLALAVTTLYRGGGRWLAAGMRMPLGTLGFSIPTLGLSAYIHYAYAVNLHDMFSDALYPERVFRYLPLYTLFAGGIGFLIGWIVGRNL